MLPVQPPVLPMLSRLREEIPRGEGWLYEPKWDGFRAIVFRDGEEVHIGSRNAQPLQRYFPELLPALREALPQRCVVDGEIVVPSPKGLDFDALSQRIHPAASRVAMLAERTPAVLVAFDVLAIDDRDLRETPFAERRALLAEMLRRNAHVALTPQTDDAGEAERWFEQYEGAGLDGVVAKRVEMPYRADERVMVKVKHERTADCVVGGYRNASNGNGVGSLLLGLYDDRGVLHHVGHTSSFKAQERRDLLEILRPHEGGSSYGSGRAPGGPSRWAQARDTSYVPLTPSLVCEVRYERLQSMRFRHAARFLRWRPDRDPLSCRYDQLLPPQPFSLDEVLERA